MARLLESKSLASMVIITIGIFYAATLREGHDWGGDFSQYILHARNIAEGRPYLDIGYIVNIFSFVAPDKYPPVFPILLAPVYLFYGLDLIALKLVVVASFCMSLLFIHKSFRVNLSRSATSLLLLVVGFNPVFWSFKDYVLSDFTFMMFSFMSLCMMQRSYDLNSSDCSSIKNIEKIWSIILLGIVMYLAYGTREVGLVLPLTILTYELLTLRKITKVSLISISVFAVFVMLQHYALKGSYISPIIENNIAQLANDHSKSVIAFNNWDFLSFDITHILRQIRHYSSLILEFWMPDRVMELSVWSLPGWILFWSFNLLALIGYTLAIWKKNTVLEIFPAGYMAVLILFGGSQGIRYLLPVLPFLIYYAFLAVMAIKIPNIIKIRNTSTSLFCLAIFLLYAPYISAKKDQIIEAGISSPQAIELWSYINDKTGPDDTFLFAKPRVLSLLTERNASAYPSNPDPEFIIQYLNAIDADYLVVGDISWGGKALKNHSKNMFYNSRTESFYSLTFKNDYFKVYRYNNQN